MPLNVTLLRRTQAQILARPEQFHMGTWDCGTTACIAGWACRLSGFRKLSSTGILRKATELIGLTTEPGRDQQLQLFGTGYWPSDLKTRYAYCYSRSDSQGAAQVASEAINWFIELYEPQDAPEKAEIAEKPAENPILEQKTVEKPDFALV